MGITSALTNYWGNRDQADATWNASQTAKSTADAQMNLINKMYEQNRSDLLPYMDRGKQALNAIWNTDPTGGMQKYLDQLDELEFKLDENDPIYQWRQSENERQVNQFMASRGKYDSRAAANMLLQSGMQLQSDEINRQYNQRYLTKYGQLTDQANFAYQQGQAKYNKLLDMVKVGTGSGQTAGMYGQNTANQASAVLGNAGTNIQNSLLQQGALANQNWQNVGNSANNAFSYYMMFSGGR